MAQLRAFKQVDVFTSSSFNGNPLAVIMDAGGLSDEQMQTIARWTNLSETTFVLPATEATADYRVRIFTPESELPFAGHPTLGTAHAVLEATPGLRQAGTLVQQCDIGLVKIRINGENTLSFSAPTATLTTVDNLATLPALGSDERETDLPVVVADMGIRWLLVPMRSADAVLRIKPDLLALSQLIARTGVNGVMPFGPFREPAKGYEVRGLVVEQGAITEDPVTGSANACLARYLEARGETADYVVHQGTAIQRAGRLHVRFADDGLWIGGETVTVIEGTIRA